MTFAGESAREYASPGSGVSHLPSLWIVWELFKRGRVPGAVSTCRPYVVSVGLPVRVLHQIVNRVLSSVLWVDSGLAPEEALARLLTV